MTEFQAGKKEKLQFGKMLTYLPQSAAIFAVCLVLSCSSEAAAQTNPRPGKIGAWQLEYLQNWERADLPAVGQFDYHIIYNCSANGQALLGLGLWGEDVTGDGPNDFREFKFDTGQTQWVFRLVTPRGGVYHFQPADMQVARNLLSSTKRLTLKFVSGKGQEVSVDFNTDQAKDALAAVSARCKS